MGWEADDPTSFQPSSSTERAGKYCFTKLATFGFWGFRHGASKFEGLRDRWGICGFWRKPEALNTGGEVLGTLCVAFELV